MRLFRPMIPSQARANLTHARADLRHAGADLTHSRADLSGVVARLRAGSGDQRQAAALRFAAQAGERVSHAQGDLKLATTDLIGAQRALRDSAFPRLEGHVRRAAKQVAHAEGDLKGARYQLKNLMLLSRSSEVRGLARHALDDWSHAESDMAHARADMARVLGSPI